MENYIKVENVSYQYSAEENEELPVLKNINLNIKKGEFVALLGHNGSGKSTIAKHFNAILLPSGGTVYVSGINTADEAKIFEIRKQVGLVLQNPDNQIVASIVEEDVAFGPENLGIPTKEIRKIVDESLKAVDMYEYRNHAPHKLSGGQKQRIAIAGILAMQPDCIVLDEPTAMLDPRGRYEVMQTICKLNKEKAITIILITHYMNEATLADRVVVMDEGEIILEGTPREVFSKTDLLKQIHLDVPQATELTHKLIKLGYSLPDDILSVEECVEEISKLFKE